MAKAATYKVYNGTAWEELTFTPSDHSHQYKLFTRTTLSKNGYIDLSPILAQYNDVMIVVRAVVGASTIIGISNSTAASSSNFLCPKTVTGTTYTKILISKTDEGYCACEVGDVFGWGLVSSYNILRNYCATSSATVTMSVVIHVR